MKEHNQAYLSLSNQLNQFIDKHYRLVALKGLLVIGVFSIGIFFGVILLELLFHFSSLGRSILFFGSIAVLFYAFSAQFIYPLAKSLRLFSRMDFREAAHLVTNRLPEVTDQLLNAIELENETNYFKSDLAAASITQKANKVLSFNLLNSLSFVEHRKYLVCFLVVFGVAFLCSVSFPSFVSGPLKRVVHFEKNFIPPNPFTFQINNNEPLVVLEGEALQVDIKTIGAVDPEQLYLFVDDQRFFPIKVQKNNFTHNFRSVKSSFNFTLVDGKQDSILFTVNVLPKAQIVSEKKIVTYPAYTKLENDTFYDLSRLVLPEGSNIKWNINCLNTINCKVIFTDTVFVGNNNPLIFNYAPKNNQDYLVSAKNNFSKYKDSSLYSIELVKDQFPKIFIEDLVDSNDVKKHLFYGEISDDYGFSSLSFHCENEDSIVFEKRLVFEKGIRSVFSLELDFRKLGLKAGEIMEYYFVVQDNDAVNGPKKSISKKMFFREPTKKQIKELAKAKSKSQNKSFSSLQKKMHSLNSQLNEIKSSLINKKALNWEDKSSLENFLKDQKKLQNDLEELKNKLAKELNNDQNDRSEDILKKQEQISKMMDELMSDEMKKLLDELFELAQEMNKEKVLDKLDNIDFSQDNMIKELDRTIEHFKKMEMEKMAKDISKELKDLAIKQDELSERTLNKDFSEFKKNQEQEQLKDEFNDIQNDLFDLKKKNQELSNPKDLNTDEKEMEINKSMEKSIEELSDNKLKKAKEQQDQSSKSLKDLAESMDKLGSNGSEQAEEDLESLRILLEHLITFSLDQEEVLNALKTTKVKDPNYVNIGQSQRKLNDEIKIIEDSLTALGLRQIMLSSKINKEVQTIKRSLSSSIKNLTERRTRNAQVEQQKVMMHTNELGLLLSEMMDQMQNNMPGSGQCNKPGGKNKKPGEGLPQSAEQMKKQIESMKKFLEGKKKGKNSGNSNNTFEQLGRMAAEQAALKKQLMEISQELNKDGTGKGNGIKEIIKKIEEVEDEIIQNNITLSSIERQQEIKIKMLELDKASKEQEEEEKRESKESLEDYKKNNSDLFEEYLQLKRGEVEMLKTIPTNLKPYYKNKVNEYIKFIEKNYD